MTPCRPCQGSGAILTPTGWTLCLQCGGSGLSQYRTLNAANRRQAYLQGKRDDAQLVAEGFPAVAMISSRE